MHQSRAIALLAALLTTASLTTVTAGHPAQAVDELTFTQSSPTVLGEPDGAAINDQAFAVTSGGAANWFPSTITVPDAQTVLDVNVEFRDFETAGLESLHILLVGPAGQQALLLANAGGANPHEGWTFFDDEAPNVVPDDSLPDGVLNNTRPSVYATPATPPAPAPALTGGTSLSVFDGSNAQGQWHLFVYDAATGSVSLPTGWALELELGTRPYPSQLEVSGVAGVISDLDVTMHVTTTWASDADLLLVGPQGQRLVLMSDVGDRGDLFHATLEVDDEADASFPDEPFGPGSYRPTDLPATNPDDYPAPAPLPDGATSLAVFDGTDPNGTWRLYGVDSFIHDITLIHDWSLRIEYVDTVPPTGGVTIDGGAARSRSRSVVLNLSASDPAGSPIVEVRLRNKGGSFSPYQPCTATMPWRLSSGDGTKTVQAQFRDAAGNTSTVVTDTIAIDTVAPRARKLNPDRGARHVAPDTTIRVSATERLNPRTVKARNVVLTTSRHTVAATVTYLPALQVIKVDPVESLAPGRYRVKVRSAVTDTFGNRFDALTAPGSQPLVWRFTV